MTIFNIAIYSTKTFKDLDMSQLSIIKFAIRQCLKQFPSLYIGFEKFLLDKIEYGPDSMTWPQNVKIVLHNTYRCPMIINIIRIPHLHPGYDVDMVKLGTDDDDAKLIPYDNLKLEDSGDLTL